MQITICDICGEKIGKVNGKDDRYTFCVSHEPDSDKISPFANLLTHGEACGECARKIRDYIDNGCRDLKQAEELEELKAKGKSCTCGEKCRDEACKSSEGQEWVYVYYCKDGRRVTCNDLRSILTIKKIDLDEVELVKVETEDK